MKARFHVDSLSPAVPSAFARPLDLTGLRQFSFGFDVAPRALDIECPRCGAKPGAGCTDGARSVVTHQERNAGGAR